MTENTKRNNDLTIRQFKIEDYDELINLWKSAGLFHRDCGRDSREDIARQLKFDNVNYLVAEMDGRMIGSILGSHDSRKGWINRLAVLPDCRKMGIATKLIDEIEKWLDNLGIQVTSCLIEDWNERSMNLAEKLGYKKLPGIIYFVKKKFPGA